MSRQDSEAAARFRPVIAAALLAVAAFLVSLDAMIVRVLSRNLHSFEIAFFRSAFGLIVVLPWIMRSVSLRRSPYRWLHVGRAALKLMSLFCLFAAYAAAPLADVTAIAFTTPIFLTLGAWVFLGEARSPTRILALLAGFAGIIIVLRPGHGDFSPALLLALAGAILTALIQLILKVMSRRDTTDRLVAWNLVVSLPLAAIPALLVWVTPTWTEFGLLALQGLLGAVSMTLMTRAMGIADASFVAPLDFLRLPFVAILAAVFFGEIPQSSTWLGAAVIFAATLLCAGEGRLRRRPPPPPL